MINCQLLKSLYFYTNFTFLILLTLSNLTNSPLVLPYFFSFSMVCIWLYLPYNCAQDSFSKWFEALSFSVTFYLLSTSTHTHLLCLCLSITRCDHRRSGLHKEKTCSRKKIDLVFRRPLFCISFSHWTCFMTLGKSLEFCVNNSDIIYNKLMNGLRRVLNILNLYNMNNIASMPF